MLNSLKSLVDTDLFSLLTPKRQLVGLDIGSTQSLQRTASMPRLTGKISLAPAVTANWLRIMAGVAVVAYGTVSAHAADEDNSTSEQSPSK